MINTNYKIKALNYLLDEKCMPERFFPLIEYKKTIISGLAKLAITNKDEAVKLSDKQYKELGLKKDVILLFRRFLCLYDVKQSKLKQINAIEDLKLAKACYELYYLPGVKLIRGSLYYYAGYRTLKDIALTNEEVLIDSCKKAIIKNKLNCIVPLEKEVRTHIAVSRAFTGE